MGAHHGHQYLRGIQVHTEIKQGAREDGELDEKLDEKLDGKLTISNIR